MYLDLDTGERELLQELLTERLAMLKQNPAKIRAFRGGAEVAVEIEMLTAILHRLQESAWDVLA